MHAECQKTHLHAFFCPEKSVNMTNILADCIHQAQKNRKKRKKYKPYGQKVLPSGKNDGKMLYIDLMRKR